MIDVFIGYDEGEKIAYHVLSESIRRNSSQPVSITPLCLGNINIASVLNAPRIPMMFIINLFLLCHSKYQTTHQHNHF